MFTQCNSRRAFGAVGVVLVVLALLAWGSLQAKTLFCGELLCGGGGGGTPGTFNVLTDDAGTNNLTDDTPTNTLTAR